MPKHINADDFKAKYLCCGYLPEMSEEEFDAFPGVAFEEKERPHCGADVKTSELKPCPFCGGTPYMQSHPVAQGKKQWAVQCRCGARFSFVDRRYKAVTAWNRRCENEN